MVATTRGSWSSSQLTRNRQAPAEVPALFLLRAPRARAVSPTIYTPPHSPPLQGDLAMLLKSKVDPNVVMGVEWRDFATSPLFEASVGGHTRIARMLINAGADVNQRVGPGYTPLYNAAFNGHTDTVKLLAECGANPNTATDEHVR